MKMQTLLHAAIWTSALAALPCIALAKGDSPMVGQAIERTNPTFGNESASSVVPVVIKAGAISTPAPVTPTSSGSGHISIPESSSAAAQTQPIERLSIQAGQRLSVALSAWLKTQKIDLSWEPAGTLPGRMRDVVIESAWLASQAALEPTLSEVLAPFGLSAHVLRQDTNPAPGSSNTPGLPPTSVVVRNASNSRP